MMATCERCRRTLRQTNTVGITFARAKSQTLVMSPTLDTTAR